MSIGVWRLRPLPPRAGAPEEDGRSGIVQSDVVPAGQPATQTGRAACLCASPPAESPGPSRHGQGDAREARRGRSGQGAQTQGEAQNQGQTEEGAQEGARRARARRSRGEGGRGRGQRSRGGRQHVRDVPNAHVAARSRFSSLRRRLKGSIGKLRDDGEWWYTFTTRLVCFATATRSLASVTSSAATRVPRTTRRSTTHQRLDTVERQEQVHGVQSHATPE